jgi:hypothetical protein
MSSVSIIYFYTLLVSSVKKQCSTVYWFLGIANDVKSALYSG